MFTQRLLEDDGASASDSVITSYEKDFKKLTAKKYQLGMTIELLKKNLATQQENVQKAKEKKAATAQLELDYRIENFDLYQSVFIYQRVKLAGEMCPGLYYSPEETNDQNYKIDIRKVKQSIKQRRTQARTLERQVASYADETAQQYLNDSVIAHRQIAFSLEQFLIGLADFQRQIDDAIREYQETLVPYQRVLDELDRNEDELLAVGNALKTLKAFEIRVQTMESVYIPPQKR